MTHFRPRTDLQTHNVSNQPPPFEDINLFSTDNALKDAVAVNGGNAHTKHLNEFGAKCGASGTAQWAREANANPPRLKSFDRYGHRLDEVEFHPSYHELMTLGLEGGVAAAAWNARNSGHVLHAALMYLMGQADGGVCCPMSMSYAAVPALSQSPGVEKDWRAKLTTPQYDRRFIPASEKSAVTMGMAMTEKQGGSDVRANTTRATFIGGDVYELTGHKWFCSAPMCDAFLTLAQTDAGITCFLTPRWRPDGTRNAFHIMRLKDKMGDRSNASSEIEYMQAYAQRVGEEGRGVRTIIDMVQHTRLDCIVGSAGAMRSAVAQALWHCKHRSAFQKKLLDQPAMVGVLADLALECEAATALAFRIARAFDSDDEREQAFARLATPIAKYWVCKRQPGVIYEALECHGGAGFVEESPMPRLYRGAPLNAIWEGSGNVIALDVLRAIGREPESLDAVRHEISHAAKSNSGLATHARQLENWLEPGALNESTARRFTQETAMALAAAALVKTAPDFVADGYARARLQAENRSYIYGADAAKINALAIIERSLPQAN